MRAVMMFNCSVRIDASWIAHADTCGGQQPTFSTSFPGRCYMLALVLLVMRKGP